jgi:hypothetical protein
MFKESRNHERSNKWVRIQALEQLKWNLTPQQDAAINLIVTGMTMKDAALVLGIPYSTVRRWASCDETFKSMLDDAHQQMTTVNRINRSSNEPG